MGEISSLYSQQYGVEVEEDSHVFVYLSQPDFRFHFKSGRRVGNSYLIEYPAIGVTVLEAETLQFKKLSIQPKDIVAVSTFVTSRDNSIEFKAVAGKKYVIVPSTLQPGIESS
jgi:glutaredoxin-related protein